MSTTPSGLLANVRDQINNDSTFYSDTLLYRYMSQGENLINIKYQLNKVTSTVYSADGVASYDTPASCINILKITYDDYVLRRITQSDYDNMVGNSHGNTVDNGPSTHYYQYANSLTLYPTPDAANNIVYSYLKTTDELTSSSDFTIPNEYTLPIEHFMLYKCYARDDMFSISDKHYRIWKQELAELTDTFSNRDISLYGDTILDIDDISYDCGL